MIELFYNVVMNYDWKRCFWICSSNENAGKPSFYYHDSIKQIDVLICLLLKGYLSSFDGVILILDYILPALSCSLFEGFGLPRPCNLLQNFLRLSAKMVIKLMSTRKIKIRAT
jgi:hypothetical protein